MQNNNQPRGGGRMMRHHNPFRSGYMLPPSPRATPPCYRPSPMMMPRFQRGNNFSQMGQPYAPRRGIMRPHQPMAAAAASGMPVSSGDRDAMTLGNKMMTIDSVTSTTFDVNLCDLFQQPSHLKVDPESTNNTVEQDKESKACDVIMKKYQDISITSQLQNLLSSLVTKLQGVIESLIVNPTPCSSIIIEEMKLVGHYKANTVLQAIPEADVVLVLKTLPTKVAVDALNTYCTDEIRKLIQQNTDERYTTVIHCEITNSGFTITIVKQNLLVSHVNINVCYAHFMNHDPEIHINREEQEKTLQMIRQSMWIEEHANNVSIKVLVRILKDIVLRFQWLDPISDWIIFVLVHNCILNTADGKPLGIYAALKRVFQVLAAGLFTPGSLGLIDPCTGFSMHQNMTYEEQDRICLTTQSILRILLHSDVGTLLNQNKITQEALISSPQVLSGIVIKPSLGVTDKIPVDNDDDEDEVVVSVNNVSELPQQNNGSLQKVAT